MIGIYKITSPTKKVYIGQSIDIEKRFNTYKGLHCKVQPILYRSFLKYGIDKHKFEILCECDINELNDKERYYQDAFMATGKNGLNCFLTKSSDRNGRHSEESRKKMSNSQAGRKLSEETKIKMSLAQKGKKRTEESKLKMSIASKGKNKSESHRKKMSERTYTEEERKKRSINATGKKHSEESKKNMSESRKKLILNIQTGIFYLGIEEAGKSIKMHKSTLATQLKGIVKNKTSFIYV